MANRNTLKSYFKTGDTPTQAQFAELITSTVNISDDHYTLTVETVLTSSEFGSVSIDCSLGVAFRLDLEMDVTIGAPSGVIDGQVYTLAITQNGSNSGVTFHSSFKQPASGSFVMPSNFQDVAIVQFYSSNGVLYLLPQTDYSG